MKDQSRIPRVLALFQEAWEMWPDLRFGQFLENFVVTCKEHQKPGGKYCIFHVEDDDWEKYFEKFISAEKRRRKKLREK
jgi:hypothetical protein